MSVLDIYRTDWLRAKDFRVDERRDLIIRDADIRTMPDGAEKVVIEFTSGDLLALNKTNARFLVDSFGDEVDDWKGKSTAVVCVLTEYRSQQVHGLRFRPVANEPNRCPITPTSAQAELQRNPAAGADLPF